MNNKFYGTIVLRFTHLLHIHLYSLVWELVQINYLNKILLSVLVNLLCFVIFTECVRIISELCLTLILNQDCYIA